MLAHTEYDFQYAAFKPHVQKATILDNLNNNKEWDKIINKVKVTQMEEKEVAGIKKLKLCKAEITDNMASTALNIWEQQIERFQLGSTYTTTPVKVCV